jgi:phage virion morphogenesis protein
MFTVELKAETLNAGLAKIDAQMTDMSPVMKEISNYLLVSTKERFKKGASPEGVKWAANSPVTLARKKNSSPLFGNSGSLHEQIAKDHGPDFAQVGSNMAYAAMMQFGGTKAAFPHLWGNIPARPFLGLSPEDETNILALVVDFFSPSTGP